MMFLFVSGILGDPDDQFAWTDEAVRWIQANTPHQADKYEYRSGAITRFIGQAGRVRDCQRILSKYPGKRLTLVPHSNGCAIVCEMLRKCPELRIDTLHLLGAACDHDFERNGLNEALRSGQVKRVCVYWSEMDEALAKGKRWTGWLQWTRKVHERWSWFPRLGYGWLGMTKPEHWNIDPAVERSVWAHREDYLHSQWVEVNENTGPTWRFEATMRMITKGVAL